MADLIIDPCQQYTDKSKEHLLERAGLIPLWIGEHMDSELSAKEICEHCYGYPTSEMGGTVKSSGVYTYEGDPDLAPLVTIIRAGEKIHIYSYGIVAFISPEGEQTIYRMD